ncbi:dystonin isoform X14 [Stigmatopora nigra]
MMIAAVFLVLLRPLSVQCALLLLLLLLGTVATILFFCSWQRNVAHGKQPVKSALSGRSKNRVGLRTHHFRSECFRHSPRHSRRSSHARALEEKSKLVEVPRNEPDSLSVLRKRKVKKRVLPEFYQSVQVTPTRKTSSGSGNPSLHCSMSSSADLSEDEDFSVKSGTASPAPGDTLPWNLPRHERSKRKIQGGSVLDAAERAVLRIADERDRVQKKTFTKWINQHLMKVRKHINDLYEDLRDGHNLISLLEVLSGDKLPREKGRMRFHRLQNVQIALDYLKRRQVKLVNIRNDDITDGNPKLTLGLIWTIILHFQISEIHVTGESQDMTAKERLLLWSKQITEGYVGVRCDNFTTSWRDGRLFNAIIHKYRPDMVDMSRVSTQTNRSNLENAFGLAEQLGVARLLDPEDVDVQSPDEKSVITYVSTLYDAFPRVPESGEGISPNDIDIKWVEYQNMIKYLSQWIKHNVAVMNERSFPNNPAELKALYTQYLQFKEHEIPLKENDKTKIKHFYKMLEVWIEFGRIHLPPGHHPNDVEKEWGKLIVAMLEREKSLRPEVERLETLQQIANRVQRDCVHGEDKLALARNSLKSDVKRLESGIQFLNEAEIAGYLLECENILRQQVVDIQVLLDGKFPFTDQLVRRVSNLRDDLLFLRAECGNLYSKGRTLTTEQTKMMISGITQSLDSGFSQNPAFPPGLTQGGFDSSTFSSSLTSSLTPGMESVSEQSYMSSAGIMEPDSLRHMTQMHIPKPLMKSLLADPSLTEGEVNMKYVQDLLKWVADMQLQLDRAEWGSDMPSVATHLENHKSVHRAIEEFEMSLKEAKLSEIQMNLPLKLTYSEQLSSLEKQYEKLLTSSKDRQNHLESLHDFVSQATRELIWLNEKEEEEVAFDWSDRNSNVSKKRDYHADLMKELDEKEGVIKSVQDFAERLLFRSHPAKLTIEAYRAAMQTQWNWILQLCSCVEQHLKENAVYFEFFSDAKESLDFLRNLQEAIQRKYRCDRTSSLHRLEDLLQESMEEKEQLLQYRNTVAGLMGRAKNIVQLKPRNPDSPRRSSIPVKAICDYRQIEITIYKDDECVLANNTHRAKWKVINPAGNEAMVPSVCFTVPPPNKDAVDIASKTEQLYQNVLSLWHHSHINMKSVVSWHCLMDDIRNIRHWNVASFKTKLPGEHQQVLSNLQSHFDEFLEDSKESEVFTVADCAQLERDVTGCNEYYQELLKSAEREEHDESLYNRYISEIRNFRMHLEGHEEHLIRQIRTPLDRDDVYQSLQRITDQEKKMAELDKFKEDLDTMKDKCELFLTQAPGLSSAPTLSSELAIVVQSMSQVQSMSSIYMDKLKTLNLVVKHSQSAEALVKAYESKLYEEDIVNSDLQSIETVITLLKEWRTEIDEKQEVFHNMEDELQKARLISDRMFKAHNERDFDLDWHREKVDQLSERWRNVHSQIDCRLRDLDGNSQSLKLYKDAYSVLDEWVREVQLEQMKAQENKPEDGKALTELLNKQKVLVAEIEEKQNQIDECQKYSEQCSSAIKDYELQLMTFRALVDSQHKSPLKKRKMHSSSDAIQQEFMDLRTRYTALVTLMTQYVKFASETLKRTEDEERSVDEEKREHGDKVSKLLGWMSNVKRNVSNEGKALRDSNDNTDSSNNSQVSLEEIVTKKEQVAEAIRATEIMLSKHGEKMSEEEREKVQKQLEDLNQACNELSHHCLSQPSLENESILERHQAISDKLEEMCDTLTLTENRLIGHQQQADNAECVTDLQQYQQEHQALQKDVLTNATALNEVITSTKRFLEENRDKLSAEQIANIETKLEEANGKAKLIQKQAEESRKDLEKVVTTAIKHESEKAAAVERLEESKNKIEGLLEWMSKIGDKNEKHNYESDFLNKDNGNLPMETLDKLLKGEKDDANGNSLHPSESGLDGQTNAGMDIDKQYERVKAHHQEILSQQQDLIMATQSAQALLDKQANVLSPEEKDKLQKNILELKGRYDASLKESEQQMKQVQCVQEELKKFQDDCEEFEEWLAQAEGEMEHLGASAGSLKILNDKLGRQKSFSEDVISHKGDLRFITISGQKVLDVAKVCGAADSELKNGLMQVDTSGTCSAVKDKLDTAASRYKTLHSKCNQLGNNLKDIVDKYKKYDDSSAGLLKWLGSAEDEARKQQSEAIAAEPKKLQTQLEDTKVLQSQMSGHQSAIDALSKTADSLITSDGNLLSNLDEIKETVDDIVERYDNLSKSVSDRNEKLQITLTRSMSVQDGLDEMMGWMEGVEASVKENGQIPLDSVYITDLLSKETAIEQDIASRQSSIAAMKSKVKKFAETSNSSSAALLQSKMDGLSKRFSDTCDKQKQKVSRLEEIKDKVEEFENVAKNIQQFITKRSQDLDETDGPGKTFDELSQLTQNAKAEMVEHGRHLEKLQTLSKELCEMSKDGHRAQIQSKIDNLLNSFSTFKETVKEKDEEVSSCQDMLGEFRDAAGVLSKWLEETTKKVPPVEKNGNAKSLEKDLQIITGLLDEWVSKDPAVQDLNSKGASLCDHIASLTSPGKAKISNKTALTNGGGPVSHSYLTNKELMTIQQNMSFINEGYSCLGDTLKRRSTEMGGFVGELKDIKKETENMMTWLEDMKKTASSWKNGATEKDAVKTQLEQQKMFEDSMQQKKEQLQKVREKLTDLIQNHPNSQEADKWRQMLEEIDAAWADISGSVLERKQHLEQSNKNLDIVQNSQLQLGQWLSEKEIMMTVLGPLSIDPNMLKMQKQQVQILQNEFKSREPQLEQLKEAASAILNSSNNQDPTNGELVRDQLATVTNKWQGLIGQLDQRDGLIDRAVLKTGLFQELLNTLGQTAAQLEDQLGRHQASSTQPDAVKKQLEDVHNISLQLREEKEKLKQAEDVHADLKAMVTEDYLKADLDRQLESVSKPLKQLEERTAKQIEQLNSTFASSQQFHQTSKDFQSWLAETLQDQSKPQSISTKVDVLQKTLNEHNNLQVALNEQEATYITIAGEGETLLQSTDGAEKLALQGQLSLLSSKWQEVKKNAEVRSEKLKTAQQRAQKFEEHLEKLSTWIKDSEDIEGAVKLTLDLVAMENAGAQVKALQKDLDKHRGTVEQMNSAAGSLLEVADTDTERVKNESESISKRGDGLSEGLQKKKESLDKISYALKEFNENSKEAKAHLEGAKMLLDTYDSQGVHANSNKNLTNMKAQQKSLEGVQNQIEQLESLAKDLVVELPDVDGVTDLLFQADSIGKEYGNLNKRLEEKCQILEGKLQGIGQFQNQIREMFSRFTDLDDELDSMPPVDLDLAVLKEQQENIESFVAQLQELMVNTDNAKDGCKRMLETDSSPDLLGLKRDLDALSKQCGKLMDRAKGREGQVQSTLVKLEELCGKLNGLEDQLCRAVDKEASQGAVGMETDIINQQLEAFKAFQKDDIDPLQTQLQDINSISQGLIQNATRGTNTKKLEDDLEQINTKWNTLNKKIAERSAQLHEALLHCGRFHDALDSLLSWLTDTEELIANQKPPSAEFKVVKAQIQEQKLLQRLLDDRKPTVELIKNEGGKVVELAESEDKEKVAKAVRSLGQRWDTLLKKAENRHKQLQSILVVTQQFHETLEPLSDWLAVTEKRLSNSEPLGTETSKLEDQITQHKALQSDIELRKKNVDQALFNGTELLKQTTGDEVVVIQGKLDGIKTKYAEITSMSGNVLNTLERVLSLSTKLHHTHEDFSSWLQKAETQINSYVDEQPIGEQLTEDQQKQKTLLMETKEQKAVVDKLNEVSSSLLDLIPWHTREGLDKLVTEDNERYRAVCDSVTQQVDQINADILKSQQFEEAMESELAWLKNAEKNLASMGEIKLGQDQTAVQLQAHKVFSMDIMRHKDSVDAIVKKGNAIMGSKKPEEKEVLKAKTKTLVEKYAAVSQLNSERSLQLERAQSLASQFWETYEELSPWLQETLKLFNQLPPPAIEYEALRQQQEELRQMRELIAEHKPHIDKMNKTGPQLLELSPAEGFPIREKYTTSEQLYTKLKADVKQRAAELDEAISKSSQFHDKIAPMLESLERMAERLRQPPSISVELDKIKEQITENKYVSVDLEKLQPSFETLKQQGEEMIARSADRELSAKAVQDNLDHMVFLWTDIQVLLEEREAKLLDVMDLAERFWCDHCALIVTIKDSQDLLRELEEPGVDPSVVKQQQEFLEGFKEEIDGFQEELDSVRNQGSELMTACGEPDKPVIKKSIDEVNSAWENLNKTWKERVDRLEEAMQDAVQFQDGLQGMFDWVDILESKLDSMSPVGTDLETVKQQIGELKEYKVEAYQLQIEMERLNHQAGLLLKKVTDENDRCAIQEPMYELKMLWGNLDEKIINRQHKLEGGLLALGQFQHALDELLAWMSHTDEMLNEQRKAGGDPKAIEIELAKHHVLQIDVLAHQSTVETVNKAGSELVQSSAGEEAACLKSKLENLNDRWKAILERTEQRKQQLESALLQAQGFHGEVEDMLQWLKDTERQLLASKAVGGLPDTAREQLNAHLELCSALEVKEELYQELMIKGQQLLTLTPEGNTEQDLANLTEKWEATQAKVADRKAKLEEALTLATDFHNSLQDFINWLTQAEQTLNMVSAASLILENIQFQIDEHKMFVTEVNSHRDDIIELDKTGTHLKYFSQKQDVVLIKNLLLSVQGRWEKLVQRSVERGRVLDDARKRAKQFHENWSKLMEWLDESEKSLDSEVEIANEPDKIKKQLSQHKEFQKSLGSKHSVYDMTSRTGRALKDKTSLQDDNQKLDDMLSELRDKWDTVCGKSIERQNKLEEALLFSGQFKDALQALIDWLYKVEPQMAEDQPVHGDIDLILNLIDNHKVFQKELGKKTVSVQALKRSARELIDSSHADSSWVKVQMQELGTRWDTVCNLSVSKQARLEQALSQAEEFHSTVHILLEWLAEAEQTLRFRGSLPEDEEALRALIDQHKDFITKLEEKQVALNKAISLGEAILSICHPDSITTIKHWNTIIKARFEEVQAWARQHQQRLATALSESLATQDLLENLLTWLQWAESNLSDKDKEALPQEIQEVKNLIAEHQAFMEEMTRKQPDVDKITKTHKRKVALEPQLHSQIPVLDKGRAGRKRSPTQTMYASATQAPIETKNPRVNLLVSKWQHVWLLALDRRRKLNDALDRLEELKEFANFDFDVWRKRYMRWMNHKKSRVMDFFRRIDKDQDGKVTRQEFIEGILSSKFPTSRLEMSAVADIFDRDGDGYIDYYEFVAALHPNKDAYKPLTDADKIEDEVTRQVAKCKCPKRFQVEQIGANKYRFGDSQQLRLVRILRSTVMVRVGGGWMALDEFLVKNDPCRAKGRTNMELREKFMVPEGTTQVMASFRYRGRRSRPSSPNRSVSSQSCIIPSHLAMNNTPKTCQHISRNYDKPWLTNSKPVTTIKSSDSFGSPGSSAETTPVQGSKLRLPGYLSGKGFQSGDDGTLINAAILKARGQAFGDSRKSLSRPGSKAGSRGSSRRGSDASDFDISDIQSVCSDASETVGDGPRTTPRQLTRHHGGKASKIPTPQRKSTPTSKLVKGSKR